jgi:hypothetical protein
MAAGKPGLGWTVGGELTSDALTVSGGAALAYGHAAAVLQGPFCPPEVLALIAADAARRDYELFQGELTLAIEYGLAAAAPAPPPGWREISPGSPIMLISAGRAEESHLNAAPVS